MSIRKTVLYVSIQVKPSKTITQSLRKTHSVKSKLQASLQQLYFLLVNTNVQVDNDAQCFVCPLLCFVALSPTSEAPCPASEFMPGSLV